MSGDAMSFDDIISKKEKMLVWFICGNCFRYAGYPEEKDHRGYCHIVDATIDWLHTGCGDFQNKLN